MNGNHIDQARRRTVTSRSSSNVELRQPLRELEIRDPAEDVENVDPSHVNNDGAPMYQFQGTHGPSTPVVIRHSSQLSEIIRNQQIISQHLHEQGQQLLRFKQTYQPLPDPPHISHLNDMGFTYQDWKLLMGNKISAAGCHFADNTHKKAYIVSFLDHAGLAAIRHDSLIKELWENASAVQLLDGLVSMYESLPQELEQRFDDTSNENGDGSQAGETSAGP